MELAGASGTCLEGGAGGGDGRRRRDGLETRRTNILLQMRNHEVRGRGRVRGGQGIMDGGAKIRQDQPRVQAENLICLQGEDEMLGFIKRMLKNQFRFGMQTSLATVLSSTDASLRGNRHRTKTIPLPATTRMTRCG